MSYNPFPAAAQRQPPQRDDWMRPQQAQQPQVGANSATTGPGSSHDPQPVRPGPGQTAVPGDQRQNAPMEQYDWAGNPRQAMLNAMAKVGGYQMTNNPYVDRLLSAAPALATSFMAQQGMQPGIDETARAGSYGQFGNFLQDALRQQRVFSTAGEVQGLFPRIVEGVRGFNAASDPARGGQDAILQNPFMQKLAELFGMNQGQGAMGLYGQAFTPFMTGAMQRPFQDMMEARYTGAANQFYDQGNQNMPGGGGNDWWKYLFGY